MSFFLNDTIVAPATANGLSAVGLVRISGESALAILSKIFKGRAVTAMQSHHIQLGYIVEDGAYIDQVLVSIFIAPRSYTGQDVVEISCHGSSFIIKKIVQLIVLKGARLAQAGEFTQRAFMNGRMDLLQAEAVADLIASETDAQRKHALQNLQGGLSKDLLNLRTQLIEFAALLELELDFSEEDVAFADRKQLDTLLTQTIEMVSALVDSFNQGNAIKQGVRVAIVGSPNAGKSTLLNSLLNQDRAIVSPIAGTTRDTIEECITIEGILYRFIDTAGIRTNTQDDIEQQGIERSKKAMYTADFILYVIDSTSTALVAEVETAQTLLKQYTQPHLVLLNKCDNENASLQTNWVYNNAPHFATISAKNKTGLPAIKTKLSSHYELKNNNSTIITNTRHWEGLKAILQHLLTVKEGLENNLPTDLITIDLKHCLYQIGKLTGQVQHDRDILGAIFSQFCIGK